MSHAFLTYFDVNYAARGLTMIESLFRFHPDAALTVLCFDAKTEAILEATYGSRVGRVNGEMLAAAEPALVPLRAQRSAWEFYATHKPIFVRWVLERLAPGALAVYVDADCFFYAGLADVLAEMDGASVGLSAHRLNAESEHLRCYGSFNAGFAIWRNDDLGRACVLDWRDRCLDWCFERVDGVRFMNQGYLSEWPERFRGVKVLSHPGQNLGPWNVGSHALTSGLRGVRVDGVPLVFYHFSSVHQSPQGSWQTIYPYEALRDGLVRKKIYGPYCGALDAMRANLQKRFGIAGTESVRTLKPGTPVLNLATGRMKVTGS